MNGQSIHREECRSARILTRLLCSKNGETPGCKGNSLRFVDGKSHPDCGAEKAERKGEKQG